MKPFLLALLLPTLLFGQQPPPPAARPARPAPTRLAPELTASLDAHPNLTYATCGDRALQLDLYRPKAAAEPLPAILCIHGGGWFKGERGHMTNLAQALAARGFVTASISYRLSGEARFPAAIQDCKAAVRFLRANAVQYGINADAIGVTGLSAGGHLAALLATSGGVAELEGSGGHAQHSSTVQACVAMGAQSDLESDRIRDLSSRPADPFYRTFLGAPLSEIPQIYALASPRHHLDKTDPPLAFMSGALDDPSTHADETRRDIMNLGIPTGLTLFPDAPHAFLNQQRPFDLAVDACAAFFTLHLQQRGEPSVQCNQPCLFPADARRRHPRRVRQVFASFGENGLDGLAFDPAGQLWVCSCIRIVSPDGNVFGHLQTPGKPTSIAFGLAGRLCVTTMGDCFVTRISML